MGLFNSKADSPSTRLRAVLEECTRLPELRAKFVLDVVHALLQVEAAQTDDISDKTKILYALISAQPTNRRDAFFKMLDDLAKAEEKPPS